MSDIDRHLPRRSTWSGSADGRDEAACRGIGPEVFFPIGNAARVAPDRPGQTGMRRMPGAHALLGWALDSGQEAGEAPAKTSGALCRTGGCARPRTVEGSTNGIPRYHDHPRS